MTTPPEFPGEIQSRKSSRLGEFLHAESAGASLLALGALVALVWANSPWAASYDEVWTTPLNLGLPRVGLDLDLRHWINDGLMTLFFFVVGLEIKRELTTGHLNSRRAAILPGVAALGGMIIPALVYLAIAGTTEPRGWAIPMATDIALAVGVLSVVGSRVPASLRAFLLALAIVDDIGAIVVIAVVYSSGLKLSWLGGAAAAVLLTLLMRRAKLRSPLVYVIIGAWMWFALHEAGVHPTIAGVAMGLLAPVLQYRNSSLIEWLQHALHPWTSFIIVPLFALANCGIDVSLTGIRDAVSSPITWGVGFGLLIGKPLGIVLASRLAVGLRVADVPAGGRNRQLLGVSSAAGIGFTVAIFITELALEAPSDQANAKLAILIASILSGVVSLALLSRRRPSAETTIHPH
jgi:NhaA family Na+:H+ antiporter